MQDSYRYKSPSKTSTHNTSRTSSQYHNEKEGRETKDNREYRDNRDFKNSPRDNRDNRDFNNGNRNDNRVSISTFYKLRFLYLIEFFRMIVLIGQENIIATSAVIMIIVMQEDHVMMTAITMVTVTKIAIHQPHFRHLILKIVIIKAHDLTIVLLINVAINNNVHEMNDLKIGPISVPNVMVESNEVLILVRHHQLRHTTTNVILLVAMILNVFATADAILIHVLVLAQAHHDLTNDPHHLIHHENVHLNL